MIQPKDDVFKYYFYFIEERMNIFWNKLESKSYLTEDDILQKHKFTNVYRVLDRVSQYLVTNVIGEKNDFSNKDIIFRILFFKIFNKIETWEAINQEFGVIKLDKFDWDGVNDFLTKRIKSEPIFSGAYIMTGSHSKYNHLNYKHEKWLAMLKEEIIEGGVADKILQSESLEEVYNWLRGCSFIGDFIAYQYAIDLNYSEVIDFDENSFVRAGIGAKRGIKKCFGEIDKNYSYEDYIKYTQDNFEYYLKKYEINNFKNLYGRNPTLIDLQNCFCETDKYLRAKLPELTVGNKRIKQKYRPSSKKLEINLPIRWRIE